MSERMYKDWFKTNDRITINNDLSESLQSAWNSFFRNEYSTYASQSKTSDFKIFKSFSSDDIIENKAFIVTKSIYDEYFFQLYGKNFPEQFYTSSLQEFNFDYITSVYFSNDLYSRDIVNTIPFQTEFKFFENKLFDIAYANYYGSGSVGGDIIVYDDSSEDIDYSYPTKSLYFSLKRLMGESDEKIIIDSPVDSILALNFAAAHLYDGIAKGSFELILCKLNGSASIDDLEPAPELTLVDTNNSSDPNLLRDLFFDRKNFYFIEYDLNSENQSGLEKSSLIVSGTLKDGVYIENGEPVIYGKIYYDLGIIVFDANKLNTILNLGLITGSNQTSNNSLRLYKSIQGALDTLAIVADGNPDPLNPYFPAMGTILAYPPRPIQTPKINVKQQINSIFYTCKLEDFEFNYSTNPSYYNTSTGELKITKFYSGSSDFFVKPETYVTSIGLYDSAYNLIAISKLSRPIRKSFDNSLIINIRIDY